MILCPACSGRGHHEVRSKATGGQWVRAKCAACQGTGKKEKSMLEQWSPVIKGMLKKRSVKKAKTK
jgi:DnaJ-class molecular chaperone